MRMGSLLGDRAPSSVSVVASPGSYPHTAAIVWRSARLCSVIVCHHLKLLSAISALAGSTFHLCRSCALVQLRPWLSAAGAVVCSTLRNWPSSTYKFLSSLFNSLGDAAYASMPVVAALTIRDRKIIRLWLHGERANQNPRSAAQFAIIAFSLQSMSVFVVPVE